MARKYKPRINQKKEYESPLGLYRVKAELTVGNLEKLTGVSPGEIAALQNGTESPVYESRYKNHPVGSWKPQALKITKVLSDILYEQAQLDNPSERDIPRLNIEDLFPRYACRVTSSEFTDKKAEEIRREYYGRTISSPEEIYERANELTEIVNTAKTILNIHDSYRGKTGGRLWDVFNQISVQDRTPQEIAEKYGVTKERIRQMEKRVIKILKNSKLKEHLL